MNPVIRPIPDYLDIAEQGLPQFAIAPHPTLTDHLYKIGKNIKLIAEKFTSSCMNCMRHPRTKATAVMLCFQAWETIASTNVAKIFNPYPISINNPRVYYFLLVSVFHSVIFNKCIFKYAKIENKKIEELGVQATVLLSWRYAAVPQNSYAFFVFEYIARLYILCIYKIRSTNIENLARAESELPAIKKFETIWTEDKIKIKDLKYDNLPSETKDIKSFLHPDICLLTHTPTSELSQPAAIKNSNRIYEFEDLKSYLMESPFSFFENRYIKPDDIVKINKELLKENEKID